MKEGINMGEIFVHINVSLDGYIEREHHDIEWQFVDDEFEEYINELLRSIDGMIFGRTAHEKLAEYWPYAASEGGDRAQAPDQGVSSRHIEAAGLMNSLPKYVVTNGPYETTWENSRIITGNVDAEFRKLKEGNQRLALFAGAGVVQSFMAAGLIDEYRLVLNPIILGSGTPLFGGRPTSINLALTGTKEFKSGALVLSYRPT
jgi:dihydrofolate reductase